MLIQRTKPIARKPIARLMDARDHATAHAQYGALFTPDGARAYLHRLCDWITQNAYDAETYFWDLNATRFREYRIETDTSVEATCTSILRSADDAIQEVLHTLSDLCAMDYTYVWSWDDDLTQYPPRVSDVTSMLKEQATLLSALAENPRYDELYRQYCGYAGPHHVVVDPAFEARAGSDPLHDALDDIWAQGCALLERLGPNFAPVYTGRYPMGRDTGSGSVWPVSYFIEDWGDPAVVSVQFNLSDTIDSYVPAYRERNASSGMVIERIDEPTLRQHVGKRAEFTAPVGPPIETSDVIPLHSGAFGNGIVVRKVLQA